MPKKVPPSTAFGQRLTSLRTARGLTQVELAQKVGSSQRAISRYETIAEFPPTPVLVDLAKALDVTTDELLGLKPPPKPKKVREDSEARRIWKKFQLVMSLPEKDRRAVIRLVNSLVGSTSIRKAS